MSEPTRASEPTPQGTRGGRPRVTDLFDARPPHELDELYRFWAGPATNGSVPKDLRRELGRFRSWLLRGGLSSSRQVLLRRSRDPVAFRRDGAFSSASAEWARAAMLWAKLTKALVFAWLG